MQKVIRRTMLAEKQAARRLAKRREKNERAQRKNTLEQAGFHRRDEIKLIKAAQISRREDWEMGPLVPKRDVGENRLAYGTINTMRSKGPSLTTKQQEQQKAHIGGKIPFIRTGDRVVLIDGRDRGKIGTVMEMDDERGECKVEGLNMMDVRIPDWMLANEQELDKRPIRSMEKPVPYSWIKLVASIRNAETGLVEEVVCRKVKTAYTKSGNNGVGGAGLKRFLIMEDGKKEFIPFPKGSEPNGEKSKHDPDTAKDTPADTLRLEVEQKTFMPTLLRPPMPGSVIDELRNKYSVFRTRHDPEYIAKKMQEQQEKDEKKRSIQKMRTPIKEINQLEKKMKKAKGRGKLTDEMLERIGKVIAEKRQLHLDMAAKINGEPPIVVA